MTSGKSPEGEHRGCVVRGLGLDLRSATSFWDDCRDLAEFLCASVSPSVKSGSYAPPVPPPPTFFWIVVQIEPAEAGGVLGTCYIPVSPLGFAPL